ncbi:MAG TPA: GDSL-type esterase/lipase family protein [Polyangiaceae bacterium]|nr:GDSL-type esterase/lipase family protein [Polyangiaceae bacterium]
MKTIPRVARRSLRRWLANHLERGASGLGVSLGLLVLACRAEPAKRLFVAASAPALRIEGRVEHSRPGRIRIGFPGVCLKLRFQSRSLKLRASSSSGRNYLSVRVDGGTTRVVHVSQFLRELPLATDLAPGDHEVEIVSRNETWQGVLSVFGFSLDPDGRPLSVAPAATRKLLFVGDSVTCGEGVDRGARCGKAPRDSNAEHSYGRLVAQALSRDGVGTESHLVCYGGRGLVYDWQGRTDVLNAPQFVDLALPELGAEAWDWSKYVPDAVVISLGTNDFALGRVPAREWFVSEYVTFVRKLRTHAPDAWFLLTEGSIVDAEQKTRLREYLHETVRRLGDRKVSVFEASRQPGTPCDVHPTFEQHHAMAAELLAVLRPLLGASVKTPELRNEP